MTLDEIECIKEYLIMAAVSVQRAGFDGVEMNAACDHLLNEPDPVS